MFLRRFLWMLTFCLPAASAHAVPALVCGDQFLQRQRERNALLPPPKPLTKQQLLRDRRAATLSIAGTPTSPRAGERLKFWSLDFTGYDGGESSIKHYQLYATLRRVGENSLIYVEDGVPVRPEALSQLAQSFEGRIMPIEHRYFGKPPTPGIDGDPRVTLLISSVRSPAGGPDPPGFGDMTVGGFINDEDEYPIDERHPFSNEREMVTLNANLETGSPLQLEALAHEYQHLIHWHYDRAEELWVNEGLSVIAPALAGVNIGPQSALGSAILAYGLDYGHSLTQWSIRHPRRSQPPPGTGAGNRVDGQGAVQSASEEVAAPSGTTEMREASPDAEVDAHDEPGADAALVHYGAAGLFFLYLQEKYGGPETLGKIVRRPEHGIAGVLQALTDAGHTVTFPELFTQWAVANLADASAFGAPPHVYGYESRELRDLRASTNALHELLPDLIPRLFQPGTHLRSFPAAGSGTLRPQAAQYLELTGTGNLTLSFDGGGRSFETFVLARTTDDRFQIFPLPLDPQTRIGTVPVPGLGSTIAVVYLVVANVSEEEGPPAEYRYQAKLE